MKSPGRTSFSLSKSSRTSFSLSKRARPRPQLRRGYESGPNRIVMNVIQDPFVFPRIAYPMVVRLMLPKLGARPAQNPVGFPSRDTFNPLGHSSGGFLGHGEKMHMVGHDHVTAESAKSLGLRSTNNVTDDPCQARVLQPQRAASGSVQLPIEGDKRSPGIRRASRTSFSLSQSLSQSRTSFSLSFCHPRPGQAEACPTRFANSGKHRVLWQRSRQTPGKKQPPLIGMPVRQMATIVGHGTGQAKACPTFSGGEGKNSQGMRI
jgi:hypothetical protein